ncbi:MAG TPA: tetratricopeptide repeat protein [Gemmatimonadaceae bacterium]|nr:tetratricopeptide repeat protein [Gemmatimonadaceae bacterium]
MRAPSRRTRRCLLLGTVVAAIVAGPATGEGIAAQQAGTRDPVESREVFRLAGLRRAHDLHGAIALYRRYVALEPADAWGQIALGDALARAGDVAGVRAAYASAERLAPAERDVHIGRARALARMGYTSEAIRSYERWLATSPGDAEATRELAAQRRRAAATVEPTVGGSRDSDGVTTWRTGATFTSPAIGQARLHVTAGTKQAGDALASRGSIDVAIGGSFRPLPQLAVDVAAGIQRADRRFIDTTGTGSTPTSGGPGMGPGGPGMRPGTGPIGRPPAPGTSTADVIPVGRVRVVWRTPWGRLRVDARASRQLLDASPYLVAQAVTRDEAGAEVDLRVVGPLHLRAFGRAGQVGNVDERNERRLVGGAIAIAPATYELSLRGQELSYGGPTALAYFAPRYVRTMELTGYTEREIGDASLALDAGAGMQQVAAWTAFPSDWSPAVRAWAQLVKPLTPRVSLGLEAEMYDARVGAEMPSFALPEGRWRYGSGRVSLRVGL